MEVTITGVFPNYGKVVGHVLGAAVALDRVPSLLAGQHVVALCTMLSNSFAVECANWVLPDTAWLIGVST